MPLRATMFMGYMLIVLEAIAAVSVPVQLIIRHRKEHEAERLERKTERKKAHAADSSAYFKK